MGRWSKGTPPINEYTHAARPTENPQVIGPNRISERHRDKVTVRPEFWSSTGKHPRGDTVLDVMSCNARLPDQQPLTLTSGITHVSIGSAFKT